MKKKKHAPDYAKNKDADVISKGWGPTAPQEAWVKEVGASVFAKGGNDPAGAFLAKAGKDRPTPHIKINECDH